MNELLSCNESSCAGRFRPGGHCPLCGVGETPDESTDAMMRRRPHQGHRGGGRQMRVDGQRLPRDARQALRLAYSTGSGAA